MTVISTSGGNEVWLRGFGRKLEEKRPLGRLRHRWENIMKMNLQEVG
jgi:hypothetical protein